MNEARPCSAALRTKADLQGGMRRGPFSDSYASSDETANPLGFLRFDAGVSGQITETWEAQRPTKGSLNGQCTAWQVRRGSRWPALQSWRF
jgi:hypothetical protein